MNRQATDWNKYWGRASEMGIGAPTVDIAPYVSPEIYRAECDKILRRTWLLVARDSEVPGPGDYIKRPIYPLGMDAVIVRGSDGIVRAFYNACPHRGSALVGAPEGTTKLFVCPYHAWSFGNDGKCRAIPGAEDFPHVDKTSIGLTPIHIGIWNGWIFLNFDETPRQTLEEYLGDFAGLFSDVPFETMRHAVDITMDLDTNWKNFVDAFNEGYHVQVLHPKTLPMVPSRANPLNIFYDPMLSPPLSAAVVQCNPEWVPSGKVLQFIYASTGATMLPPGDEEGTDLEAPPPTLFTSCQAINRIGLPNFGLTLINVFPLSQVQVLSDRVMWYQFWPMGVDKTRFVLRLYFASRPASYLQAFAEAHMLASTRDIVTEDSAMTRVQQEGMRSGGVKQMHLGESEFLVRYTHEIIQSYMQK